MATRARIAEAVAIAAATSLLTWAPRVAAGCVDYGYYTHWVGGVAIPDFPRSVAIAGAVAVVSGGASGLTLVDIRDPETPVVTGAADTPGYAQSAVIVDHFALVADAAAGIQVVDIADPAAPRLLGGLSTPGEALDVAVTCCEVLCVADGEAGFTTIDISRPDRASVTGRLELPVRIDCVAASGRIACVGGSNTKRAFVIDVSNPAAPRVVSEIEVDYGTTDLLLSGTMLYQVDGSARVAGSALRLIDLSHPATPVVRGQTGVGEIGRIALWYPFVAVANLADLEIVDVSDPASPMVVWRTPFPDAAAAPRSVSCSGDFFYAVSGGRGLDVFAISDPPAPPVYSSTPMGRWLNAMETSRTLGVLDFVDISTDTTSWLLIADLADSTGPEILARYPLGTRAGGLAVQNGLLYVTRADSSLDVIDISDPGNPRLVRTIPLDGPGGVVAVTGSLVCLGTEDDSWLHDHFKVIDLSLPDSIAVTGGLWMTPDDLAAQGGHAYALMYDGLQTVDLANPSAPEVTGMLWLDRFSAEHVALAGDIAYILCSAGMFSEDPDTLVVADVSDVHTPARIASLLLPYGCDEMCLDGDLAYVHSSGARGIVVIDVSEPASPRHVITITSPFWRPRVAGGMLWVFESDGLMAYPTFCAGGPLPGGAWPQPGPPRALALAVSPNPSTRDALVRFDLPRAARVTLEVFDAAGRLVRRIDGGALGRGAHDLCWNGRDEQGRAAASGVYFARLRVDDSAGWEGASRSARIVRLR